MKHLRNILVRRKARLAVDLGTDAVRILAVEAGEARQVVCLQRPTDAELRSAVRTEGLQGSECRITLSTRLFRMEPAAMPPMSEIERARSARFEAMDRFGLDPEAAVVRHAPLGADGRQVLLMAADTTTLSNAVGPILRAGLMPVSVEPAAWSAIRGAIRWGGLLAEERTAFVHLEPDVASVAVVHDGTVESFRCMHGHWGDTVATQSRSLASEEGDLALEPESDGWKWSALAEEMVRALRGPGESQGWPVRMLLTGTGADDASLARTLSGVCGLPAVAAGSSRWLSGAELRGEVWASAIGSAAVLEALARRRAA